MKEKLKIFLITIVVIVCLMVVLFIGGVIANDLGVTDIITKFCSVEIIEQWLLYDHIQYNGVDYYIVDSRLVPDFSEGDTIYFSRTDIPYTYVDKNAIPYDPDYIRYAWSYEKDPEMMFLFTGSAVYTRDLELANTVVTD